MNDNEPQVSLAGRYSIKQTCQILGIHRDTLRAYTDSQIIRCEYRKLGARRVKFYRGSEILRFWKNIF